MLQEIWWLTQSRDWIITGLKWDWHSSLPFLHCSSPLTVLSPTTQGGVLGAVNPLMGPTRGLIFHYLCSRRNWVLSSLSLPSALAHRSGHTHGGFLWLSAARHQTGWTRDRQEQRGGGREPRKQSWAPSPWPRQHPEGSSIWMVSACWPSSPWRSAAQAPGLLWQSRCC